MSETGLDKPAKGWKRVVTPHPAIEGSTARRKAQLVIALALGMLCLLLLGILILPFGETAHQQPYYLAIGSMIAIMAVVYALSLTRFSRAALITLLGSFLVFPLLLLLAGGEASPDGVRDIFLWVVLSLGVGALLLPLRLFSLFAGLNFVELLSLPILVPGVSLAGITVYLAYTLAILLLIVIAVGYYAAVENDRHVEVIEANRRLQELSRGLELSVADRTSELLALERKFQALTDNNPLPIMRFDRDLRFAYANPTAKRLFMLPATDALPNLPLTEFPFDPDVAPLTISLAASVLKVIGTGEDLHAMSATGAREFEWWLVAERDGEGHLASVLVSGMDVTEQHRVERQVIESEARFRAISDASPMGIFVDAPDGACVYFNNTFQIITGLSEEEILSGKRDEIIHPDDRERLRSMRGQLLSAPPYSFESVYRFLRTDGRVVWVNSKEAPMWDGGNLIGFVGVVEDITAKIDEINARLESDEALRRRTDELERAVGELEGFSYTVAHDLRAPLRAIDGFANILQREYQVLLPADGMRLLDTIRQSAQQMGMLIDDLLSFSRLGRQSLNLQIVNMNALAEQVVGSFAGEPQGRNLKIAIQSLPPCYGDPSLLRQVWVNLVSNSVKFTRHVENAEVEIGCSSITGKQAVYYVRDNGAGFDMAFANKLFGVFQRLHRPDEFEGTGVGLAIVQRIVQRHEGKVWAKGAPGRGATFYFSLPLRPSAELETSGGES
jgi:PAS domain S-box-containing protein